MLLLYHIIIVDLLSILQRMSVDVNQPLCVIFLRRKGYRYLSTTIFNVVLLISALYNLHVLLYLIVQLLKGEKAEIILSSLPIGLGFTPRCWVISNNGKMIIIGYEEGMIQVQNVYKSISLY